MPNRTDSFYTMTPGSAVASELQDILATKRAESRQSMIDELTAKQAEAQMRNAEANTEALNEQRRGWAEEHTAKAAKLKTDTEADQAAIESIKNFPNTPDFKKLTPEYQTAYMALVGTKNYAGINTLMSNYTKEANTNNDIGRLIIFDNASGKATDATTGLPIAGPITKNDKVVERSRAAQAPAASFPSYTFKDEIDPETGKPTGRVVALDSRSGKAVSVKNPEGVGGIGLNKPTTPKAPARPITPQEANALGVSKGKAAAAAGKWFGGTKNLAEYRSKASTAVTNFRPETESPNLENIKRIARTLVNTQNIGEPTDSLVQGVLGDGLITEADVPLLTTILQSVWGQ